MSDNSLAQCEGLCLKPVGPVKVSKGAGFTLRSYYSCVREEGHKGPCRDALTDGDPTLPREST